MLNLVYYKIHFKCFNQTNNGDKVLFSLDRDYILENISKIKDQKVLIVGDLAIDEMIYGDTERISREAPVLILLHNNTKIILGGGSNAAHNISALNNGKAGVVGVIGDDYHAPILINAFKYSIAKILFGCSKILITSVISLKLTFSSLISLL